MNISYETILSKNKKWEYYLVYEYKTKFNQVLKEEYFISFENDAHDWLVVDLTRAKKCSCYNKNDSDYLMFSNVVKDLMNQIAKNIAREKINKYFENIINEYDQNIEKQFKDLEEKKKNLNKIKVRLADCESEQASLIEEPAKTIKN